MEPISNSILGQMNQDVSSERINRLIDSLMNADFIKSHQLSQLSLEALGEKLFSAKEQSILSPEGHSASDVVVEKCIHDYCLLLQELEDQKITDFTVQTLPELRQRETKTKFIKAMESVESVEIETATENDLALTLPEPPPIDPLMSWDHPVPPDDISPVASWMQEGATQANDFPLETAAPSTKSEIALPEMVAPETTSSDATAGETPAPLSEFRLEPPQALDNTGLTDVNGSINLHPVPSTDMDAYAENEIPLAATPSESSENTLSGWVAMPPPLPPQTLTRETVGEANFWKSAEAIEAQKFNSFPEEHRHKLAAISYCWSVEKELSDRLWSTLETHWADRAIAIVTTLDTAHRKFDLHPSLRSELEKRAAMHSDFLYEGRLPHSGLINSLRYILATEELDKFRPSILDWGVVLFWFGKEEDRHGVKFSNLLGIEEVATSDMTELVFRLFHLNKLRMKALAAGNTVHHAEVQKIKTNAKRILDLLGNVRKKTEWQAEQVA